MTYKNAIQFFRHPAREVNSYDASFAEGPKYATGYRIYALDKDYNRYSPTHNIKIPNGIEQDVFYWHNKSVAEAYMVYLADARPQITYGLFPVEAERKETPWPNNYGQMAETLKVMQTAPIKVLTPNMISQARQNPDVELFSD